MWRYHVHRALRRSSLSRFEEDAVVAGVLLVVAGVIAAPATGDAGGLARALGTAGLAVVLACAGAGALRLYRRGTAAPLPTSVARVAVRTRPHRIFNATTVALATGLPLAAGATGVVLLETGWLAVAGLLLVACACTFVTWLVEGRHGEEAYTRTPELPVEVLERLCMRAGMRSPGVIVVPWRTATAWTAGGRIHVTRGLLDLLDDAELEAVLAHELAHLAHRDAPVMEICSAPSRVLLTFVSAVRRFVVGCIRNIETAMFGGFIVGWALVLAAVLGPPAFVIGWISRLSVLGLSRAREFSADAAASTLTGRPSALASALLKLEGQGHWAPRSDLRQVEAYDVLCIVGPRARLGRLFSTHPPTAARVRRLEELEARIHARSQAC